MLPTSDGKILFQGKETQHLPPDKIVDMGIIQIPEGRHIFAPFTVYENLMVGCYVNSRN